MKKKIFATLMLAVIAALCLTFAAADAGRSVNADAGLKNKNIIMEETAAIRTSEPMGIRFTARIRTSVRENATEYGMYICPADLLPGYGEFPVRRSELEKRIIPAGQKASPEKYIEKIRAGKGVFIAGSDGYDTVRIAMVGLKNRNYDREFAAMAYVADVNGNETYSDTVAIRCISDVARAAINDPESEIAEGTPAAAYLNNIIADSNDIVISGGGKTDETGQKTGSFCHKISAEGSKTCTFGLRREFRDSKKAVVTLDAKASVLGMTICGQEVPADDFKTLEFIVAGDRFNLEVAGTGDLYIDNISVSVMNPLGVDGVTLGGNTDNTQAAIDKAELKTLPDGNIEYNSDGYGYSDLGLNVAAKEVPEDEYFVFRFRYNADMEDPAKAENEKYFHAGYMGNEGLWFQGKDDKYYATFGDDLKDYTIYTAGENGTPYGSYHGTYGLTTKPDTWYYAVAPTPGNPGLVRHYFNFCHIEISGMYSVPETLKNKLFVKRNYPGKDFVPLAGDGIKDLGLGVLKKPADNDITLADDGFYGYINYSNNNAWGNSRIEFDGLGEKMSAADYFVMKFKYSEDNSFADNANNEGLYFGLYYDDNVNPYLQVFDEDGYDYTRYQSDGTTPCGTYHNSHYSTEPGKWYYMLNRAGIPNNFETGLAGQRCVIGGVYAISETVKNTKFVKGKRPVLLRVPYDSKVINIGDELTPDIEGVSYNVTKSDLEYASDNLQVAEVSDQGVITGKGFGKCEITVSLRSDPAKSAVMAITVTDLQVEGGNIREFPLKDLSLRGGHGSLTYNPLTDTATYNSGGYSWSDAGFKTGEFVGADEYFVLKFRYMAEMEDNYFTPDTYSNEGLWIMGYDFGGPDGASGLDKNYFSIFDEDYYDYTLYQNASGSWPPYEGNDDGTKVPYGSFHGTKGITTKPDTWYYAVAPKAGGYQSITSCNSYLYIEIGGIYAVNQAVRNKFVAQHYPTFINLPYDEVKLYIGDEINTGEKITPDILASSIKSVTAENLRYELADTTNIVTLTDGTIKGVNAGECDITVSLSDNSCEPKIIRVTVLSGPKPFLDKGLYNLSVTEGSATLTASAYGKIYSAPGKNQRDAQIILGGAGSVGAGNYLVLKFRYFDDMYFAENSYGNEGLWFLGFHESTGYKDPKYFAIFDEDYYDYTIYKTDDADFPYGSYHGTDGITTKPNTWYYAVAPVAGNWYSISTYFNGAHLEIAGIYAVASDKVTSDNALFKIGKGNYPGTITAPREMSVLMGEARDIDISLTFNMPDSDGPATEYSSGNTDIAAVNEDGIVTGVSAGECFITVRYRKASKRIKVHVLPVPEMTSLTGDGVRNIGTDCITTGTGVCKAGNMAHFEAFESKAGKESGHDLCSIALSANAADDEYLVFKAMYTPGMKFVDGTNDEGLWLLGHRDDAVYNTDAKYDYFSVLGEDGTDYTIYNSRNLPYGSYHNFSKDMTTMPNTWYYFIAPQKGGYTDFSSYFFDADIIIGGVYGISGTYYNANIIGKLDIPAPVCRLEMMDADDSGKLSYSAPRERLYAAKGNESNEFRLAADVPADKYLRFEIEYGSGTDLNSLKAIAARGRKFYSFSLFGTDEDEKDYNMYENGDIMQEVCGIHNTEANTSYYLVAPLPGNFDWFALRGDDSLFGVTIKNVEFIDEATRNDYVAIATNNSAETSEEPGTNEPVITFGVLADSHIYTPNPDYNPEDPASKKYLGSPSLEYSVEHFETALRYFKDQGVDALLLNGDIIDHTAWDHQDDGTDGTSYIIMNDIMDRVWGENRLGAPANVMYTLGNHEYYSGMQPEHTWSEWEKAGYTRWQSFESNGYTFISMDISTHDGVIDERTKYVVEKRLEAADAADPTKPIFVTLHIPPLESVLNNTWGPKGNEWINNMLETYPQIVMFGSHTHYSTRHPQSINQNRATVVNVGPGTYGCVPLYNPLYTEADAENCKYHNALCENAYAGDVYEEGTIDGDYSSLPYADGYNELCAGLVVSVYATGDEANPHRVEIKRVNLLNGQRIADDWSFTATKDKTKFVYTKEKQEQYFADYNQIPHLSAEGDNCCSVAWSDSGEKIKFNLKPSNDIGNNVVDCYRIEIYKTGETTNSLYTKNYVSDYWLTNGMGNLTGFEMFVKAENRVALTVKVKALDAYGTASNELSFDLGAPNAA